MTDGYLNRFDINEAASDVNETAPSITVDSNAEAPVQRADGDAIKVGSVIDGHYEILEHIGNGGMGAVYRVSLQMVAKSARANGIAFLQVSLY